MRRMDLGSFRRPKLLEGQTQSFLCCNRIRGPGKVYRVYPDYTLRSGDPNPTDSDSHRPNPLVALDSSRIAVSLFNCFE